MNKEIRDRMKSVMAEERNLAISRALSSPPHAMCGNCGADQERIHNFYHRSSIRRLCTTCILRLNPNAFCPHCFSSPPPSIHAAISCSKCYSSSHLECLPSTIDPATRTRYICPLCENPSSPIFKPKMIKPGFIELDGNCAKILLKAADIAASSMAEAAKKYRAEAEKRVMEAAEADEIAKDAVKHSIYLQERENTKRSGHPLPVVQASGSLAQRPSDVSTVLSLGGMKEEDKFSELQQTQNKYGDGGEEYLGRQ